MKGANLSIRLDIKIIEKLESITKNKSRLINQILKRDLFGLNGIDNEINNHKTEILKLENEKEIFKLKNGKTYSNN